MNEILTVKEVAELLKTNRVQVRKMIVKSKIVCKIHQVNIGNYQSTLDFCRWQSIARRFIQSAMLLPCRNPLVSI